MSGHDPSQDSDLDASPARVLAANVARLRQEVHWTTRAFAEHSGLTPMTLYEIEHAKYKTVSLDTVERLAKGFGVHWVALLSQSHAPRLPNPGVSIRDSVAAALVHWRGVRGMTQEELSKQAGVNRSLIADIERRARNISLDVLLRLATALGVSLIDLMK